MTLPEMIRHLQYLDRKAAILDRRTKQVKAEAAEFEYHVHEKMREIGMEVGDSITLDGTRWGRQVDWYAVIQDPLEFELYAQEHAQHLIRPKPAKATLNQLVQKHKEDGTPLPPGIGASPKIWVSRRAS